MPLIAAINWLPLIIALAIMAGLFGLAWLAGLMFRRQERDGDEQHFFDHH